MQATYINIKVYAALAKEEKRRHWKKAEAEAHIKLHGEIHNLPLTSLVCQHRSDSRLGGIVGAEAIFHGK
jgi:hypothetical protein